jgi:hypothetical protein
MYSRIKVYFVEQYDRILATLTNVVRHDVQYKRVARRWQSQGVSTAPSRKSSAVPERQALKNLADLRFSRPPSSARHFTLKMEAGTSSETLPKFYHSTQWNISEANNLQSSIKLASLGGPSIRSQCCAVANQTGVSSWKTSNMVPCTFSIVQYMVSGQWSGQRSWRTSLMGVVKWRRVGFHLHGTSMWHDHPYWQGRREGLDQTWRCRSISDSLLGYSLEIPPTKNQALRCKFLTKPDHNIKSKQNTALLEISNRSTFYTSTK